MDGHFLDLTDGRLARALRAVRVLVGLGLVEDDVTRVMSWYRERCRKKRAPEVVAPTYDLDREKRVAVAQWAIRFMMTLGFCESEIAWMAGVDHSSISRALDPEGPRVLSQQTVTALEKAVKGAGGERLKKLLPGIPIKVLDACCDKGRVLDDDTRATLGADLRTDLLHAVLFSASPSSLVSGIHAYLAQVGSRSHGLYLFKVPAELSGTIEERIAHMRGVEHEMEHILDRLREERQQVEKAKRMKRTLPSDGGIA